MDRDKSKRGEPTNPKIKIQTSTISGYEMYATSKKDTNDNDGSSETKTVSIQQTRVEIFAL